MSITEAEALLKTLDTEREKLQVALNNTENDIATLKALIAAVRQN